MPRCTTKEERTRFEGTVGSLPADGPLSALARAIDEVRRAPRKQEMRVGTLPDPAPAIGLTRHQIESTLGKGYSCNAPLHAPCTKEGQSYYPLYHLPAGARGGGAELVITFQDDRCVDAKISGTR